MCICTMANTELFPHLIECGIANFRKVNITHVWRYMNTCTESFIGFEFSSKILICIFRVNKGQLRSSFDILEQTDQELFLEKAKKEMERQEQEKNAKLIEEARLQDLEKRKEFTSDKKREARKERMREQKELKKPQNAVEAAEDTSVSYHQLLTKRLEGGASWIKDSNHEGWILGEPDNLAVTDGKKGKNNFHLHQESLSRQINRLRPSADIDLSEEKPEALHFFTEDNSIEFDNDIYQADHPNWREAYKSLHLLKEKENRPKNRLAAHTLPAKFLMAAKYQLMESE
jgi:hypothetical protein